MSTCQSFSKCIEVYRYRHGTGERHTRKHKHVSNLLGQKSFVLEDVKRVYTIFIIRNALHVNRYKQGTWR
jgi:hypothetical protein